MSYHRSPQNLRSGAKGKPVALSTTDKSSAKSASSLLRPLTSSSITTMPPVDSAFVEECVTRCLAKLLSGGDTFDCLVQRLTLEVKTIVEAAVTSATAPLRDELKNLRQEVAGLMTRQSKLEGLLVDKTDELEQYQRRSNVRIFGIEETAGENTDQLVVDLCRDKLGLELPVDRICRSHRVGRTPAPATDGRPRHRPIIVRFVSYRDRRSVFDAKRKLKGSGVTVREDLTSRRLEVFTTVATRHGLKNTWTRDGRVMWIDGDGRRGSATRMAEVKAPDGIR